MIDEYNSPYGPGNPGPVPGEGAGGIEAVLDRHRPLPLVESGEILVGYGCPAPCAWGNEGGCGLDAHRSHVAAALRAHLLSGPVIEAAGLAVARYEGVAGDPHHEPIARAAMTAALDHEGADDE